MNRYDGIYIFDVKDGNPNGDPDMGNVPRMDPETSHGLVTDVCIKRKIRNFVDEHFGDLPGNEIYVKSGNVLNEQHKRAYASLSEEDKKDKSKDKDKIKIKLAGKWMCKNFYDIRTFGGVLNTGTQKCGAITGPVQFSFFRSVHPVSPMTITVSRCAVTEKKKSEQGAESTFGKKHIVNHAVYVGYWSINPSQAIKTGFDEKDMELLKKSFKMMFEGDRSAARGIMSPRKCIAFKHENLNEDGGMGYGNAIAGDLYDRLTIKTLSEDPPEKYSDYSIELDTENLPSGITVEEWV